ncbi:MAG: hypothetical protein Q4D94_05560 [Bacillota bacterium]|nr:hypothetical protein [Bacillota bacterium]
MAIYRINIDLLEAAKDEYISSAEKLRADIDTSYTTIHNTNEDIYAGTDALTFRDDFTRYVDNDFTTAWETVSHMGAALDNGLDDARGCKKLCNDFVISLGGDGNGKSKEDMRGELYCDQSMIALLKTACMTAMSYADSVRMEATAIDNILAGLEMVQLNSAQYTNAIREGCDKVDKLEDHSRELTAYASAAETIDESFKNALDACVLSTFIFKFGIYTGNDISPQADILIEIMNKPVKELTEADMELLDKNLRILTENNDIAGLQKVAENIGNGVDGEWTVCDVHVAAKILNYGEVNCNANLAGVVYNKMKKVELIQTRKQGAHIDWPETIYVYEASLDEDKVASILGELDPKEEGLAYYSLQRRSKYYEIKEVPVDGIFPEEPGVDFAITFENIDGKLVSVFDLEGEKTMLASVDMNEVVGEEGKTNLRKLGFSEEESVMLMSSIYENEDICFIGDLAKANTQDDYHKLFQQHGFNNLSSAVTEALYQYSYGLLSQNITYDAEWNIEEGEQGLSQLEKFANGLLEADIHYTGRTEEYLTDLAVQSSLQLDFIACTMKENLDNKESLDILTANYEMNAKLYGLYAVLLCRREENSKLEIQRIGNCIQISGLELEITEGDSKKNLMDTNFGFQERIIYYDEEGNQQTITAIQPSAVSIGISSGNNSLGVKTSNELFAAEKERKMAVPKSLVKAGILAASVFQPWVGVAAGVVESGMTLERSVMKATAKDTFSNLNTQYWNGSKSVKTGIAAADGLMDTILSYREADRKVKEIQKDIETTLFGEVITVNDNVIAGEGTYTVNSLLKRLELETNGLSFMADPAMRDMVTAELEKNKESDIVSSHWRELGKTSLKEDEMVPALYLVWTGEGYEDSEIDNINKLEANDIKTCMDVLDGISQDISEDEKRIPYVNVKAEAYMDYDLFEKLEAENHE